MQLGDKDLREFTYDEQEPGRVSQYRTPWAVICDRHGIVHLTYTEYKDQMSKPDYGWICPNCSYATWCDDEYEAWCDNNPVPNNLPRY